MEAPFIGHRAGPGDVLGSQNHALVLQIAASLHSLFRKDKAELDLGDELQFHLQNQIEEFVAHGMNPQEARRAALQSLGGLAAQGFLLGARPSFHKLAHGRPPSCGLGSRET